MHESHVDELCRKYPAIDRFLKEYGNIPIARYLSTLHHERTAGILPPDDLTEEVKKYLTPCFGKEIAEKTALLIDRVGCFSTAGHFHMPFDASVVQENILCDHWLRANGENDGLVPFLAASNMSLTNSLYPRGLQIYDCRRSVGKLRIPLFPLGRSHACIAGLEALGPQHAERALARLVKERTNGNIDTSMQKAASSFIEEVLLSEEVQNCGTFREQVVRINARISSRYFTDRKPLYIWMDLETIALGLFIKDIENDDGMLYNLLFSKKIRNLLMHNLEGTSGCWTGYKSGTHFFWGLDEGGVLFPMHLVEMGGQVFLSGKTSREEIREVPFTRKNICKSLTARQLLPSLFIIFLEVFFLRDYTVLGGYFQPSYLSRMRQGIVQTLEELGIFKSEAEILGRKESRISLGPIYMSRTDGERTYPVSSAELFEQPVSTGEVDSLLDMTLADAYEMLDL